MLNKIKAITLGHAIGDALGVPVEFCGRNYLDKNPIRDMIGFGTYNVPAGTWSDDTSMSLCALESLAHKRIDYDDIMQNFGKWYYMGEFTATGKVFDIGNTCHNAIHNYHNLNCSISNCGESDVRSNGNGSLMRIYPFVLYGYYNNVNNKDFIDLITNASSLTHAHKCSIDGCIIYSYILKELIHNPSKTAVYTGLDNAKNETSLTTTYYDRLFNDIQNIPKEDIKSGGFVVHSLEAAIWCLLTTDNYKDCVLKAVNLGGDTDTTAAIAGSLAGVLYGLNDIPKEWLNKLKKKEYIDSLCQTAYENWRINEI